MYRHICTSSGSEDFGLPYSPREREARKKQERERDARLAEEEEEEEGRDSLVVLSTDSDEDPGASTRSAGSQIVETPTANTGTTRSSS
jgi:hypothetical protein